MNSEFEKYAREQFNRQEVEVDTDALWADVYPHVRKEKGNTRLLWFFFFGILLGAVSIAWFSSDDKGTNHIQSVEVDNNSSTNKIFTSGTVASVKQEANKKEVIPAKITNSGNEKIQSPSTVSKSGIDNQALKPAIQSTNSNPSTAIQQGPTPPVTNKADQASIQSKPTSNQALANQYNKATITRVLLPTLVQQKLEQNTQQTIPFFTTVDQEASIEDGKPDPDPPSPPPPPFVRDLRFGLGLYTGIGKSSSVLSTNIPDDKEIIKLRNGSERRLETVHFGINAILQKELDNEHKIQLRTGIEFTRMASVFTESSEFIENDSVPGIVEIITDKVTGLNDTLYGQVAVTRITEYNKRTYNYIQLLDVPVIFGWHFGNDPWSIGFEAGAYANISTRYEGEILQEDGLIYNLEDDPNGWYKTNLGVRPYIGIHAAYNLSENIQVHLSPGFKFSTVFTTDKSLFKETHSDLSIQAGIRYLFD